MQSRTAEGKHTKRFIVLMLLPASKTWQRSGNDVISGFFATREAAQAAVEARGSRGITYKIRQK